MEELLLADNEESDEDGDGHRRGGAKSPPIFGTRRSKSRSRDRSLATPGGGGGGGGGGGVSASSSFSASRGRPQHRLAHQMDRQMI